MNEGRGYFTLRWLWNFNTSSSTNSPNSTSESASGKASEAFEKKNEGSFQRKGLIFREALVTPSHYVCWGCNFAGNLRVANRTEIAIA